MQTDTASSTERGDAPDNGRTFADLITVRDALWRDVNDLDTALNDLRGDLSAVHAMSMQLTDRHQHTLGPAADGLWHCSSRALDALGEVRELQKRLHEAALVVKANAPTRLSGDAPRARFERGPPRDPAWPPEPPDRGRGW